MEFAFCEAMQEEFGDVSICGFNFSPGYALKEVSPVDFELSLKEFTHQLVEAGIWTRHEDGTIHDASLN
jgi:hypothetical protein